VCNVFSESHFIFDGNLTCALLLNCYYIIDNKVIEKDSGHKF